MALYFGNDRVQIKLDNKICNLNMDIIVPSLIDVWLLSSDNYILMDNNGIYLIPKEEE